MATYSQEEQDAFKRKDWLVLYETLYKANASVLVQKMANEVEQKLSLDATLSKLNAITEADVEKVWRKSQEVVNKPEKYEEPF